MTNEQKQIAEKYVATYPYLRTLIERAQTDPAAAKTLGDQIGRLAAPASVSGSELWEITKLGV
jgi:hypothetical protein